ncbi:MAG: tetratricopeptide repeat protein [Candidatus Omnitrophica bacterium]|nr:tetratricopeptide repeat protein [Candidatus Omnitrophota bacterium]
MKDIFITESSRSMNSRVCLVACTLIIIAGTAASVWAAVVVLKSGEEISGIIVKKEADSLEMTVNGERVVYKTQDVKEIRGRKAIQEPPEPEVLERNAALQLKKALGPAIDGRFQEAAQMLEKIVEANPAYENAKEALFMCRGVIGGTIKPDYARCVLEASFEMLEENYTRAIDLFKKGLIMKPDAVYLNYNIGYAYQELDEDQEALPYFEKFNDSFPDEPDVLAFLGTSYKQQGKIEKGNDYLQRAKKIFQDQGDFVRSRQMQMLIEK